MMYILSPKNIRPGNSIPCRLQFLNIALYIGPCYFFKIDRHFLRILYGPY